MEDWSPERLRAWQDGRLRALIRHSYDNVPFYRSLWRDADIDPGKISGTEDLVKLPAVTKSMLVAAGDRAFDRTSSRKSMKQGRSSGSTGEPFVYYKNREHQDWWIASNFLGWQWAGWQPGERWVRLQFRGELTVMQRLADQLFKCMNMPIDRFDDELMSVFASRIAEFRPVLFRTYADGGYVFAKWLVDNGQTSLRPKAVITTGSTLYPHYREIIEQAFSSPVFDTYGGEGMAVANQCANGVYHILPPVHIDLQPEGQQMEDGWPCRMLLTSLTNTAMPMIRYDIGDIAIPHSSRVHCCGCTWPSLQRIVGRDTDIVVTPTGNRLVVHHFNNCLRKFDSIRQFQVMQESLDHVVLKLVVNEKFTPAEAAEVRMSLTELLGDGCKLDIKKHETIPASRSGKRRYIISKIGGSL